MFFLAGVPADTKELDNDRSYPKGLKIFTQYVLIPLATVYVLILLAYEVKLLAEWSLPKGLVSNLILGYAVFGILSILLVYPVREQEGNKWIKTYARSFYFLLIPLLILLFLALGRRISAYGITEDRYFLLVLACWLLFITAYFLLSKKQNIKMIPISLCLLALLSVYGPQSAFSVSTYSQRRILISIFKKYHAFNNNKLVSVQEKMSPEDGRNAIEKLRYLVYNKDFNTLQPYINANLTAVKDSLNKNSINDDSGVYSNNYEIKSRELKWIKTYLGLNNIPERYGNTEFVDYNKDQYKFSSGDKRAVNITGYDFLLPVTGTYTHTIKSTLGDIALIEKTDETQVYTLSIGNEQASFDLKAFADSLITPVNKLQNYKKDTGDTGPDQNYIVAESMLNITKQTQHYTITFRISSLTFNSAKSDTLRIMMLNGWYLVKKK